mgnify:CR=1 FL=1|tara:strand:- start:137 stop:1231 length:1095 start_codon:yes stop_codon:yes gene_type:complete
MANLKNNFKSKNIYFLNLAFEQAKINLGSTKTNPSVGCIVEKDGAVISSACTSFNGRPHAEFKALNKKKDFKNSNIYVTLEPCSHYGLTPPCTNIIVKKKIKKVFFSAYDSDKRSRKKSKNIFKRKGILTKGSLLKKDGLSFYQSYYLQHSNNLPLIDAKLAISKDYFTKNIKTKWITNFYSRRRSHLLRSMYDCLISTSKSINDDDSFLDCRIDGLEKKSPDLVILDRNLRLKKKLSLYKKRKNRKILLFTSSNNKRKILYLKKKGIKVFLINSLKSRSDFSSLFFILKNKGYSRIFVESGLTFLNFLIKNKFLKNIYLFKTAYSLKKSGINYSSSNIIKKINLKNLITVNLFGDKLYKERLK